MFIAYFCYICLFFRAFRFQFQQKTEHLHNVLSNMDDESAAMRIAQSKKHFKELIHFHIKYKKFVFLNFSPKKKIIFLLIQLKKNSKLCPFSVFSNAEISYGGILFIQAICGTFYIATSVIQMELVCGFTAFSLQNLYIKTLIDCRRFVISMQILVWFSYACSTVFSLCSCTLSSVHLLPTVFWAFLIVFSTLVGMICRTTWKSIPWW